MTPFGPKQAQKFLKVETFRMPGIIAVFNFNFLSPWSYSGQNVDDINPRNVGRIVDSTLIILYNKSGE